VHLANRVVALRGRFIANCRPKSGLSSRRVKVWRSAHGQVLGVLGNKRTMKIFCTIGSVASIALEVVISHGQAHAQAAGCIVVEVMADDQEAFRQKLPPALDKRGKEKIPKHTAQQGTMDDAGTHPTTREMALPQGRVWRTIASLRLKSQIGDERLRAPLDCGPRRIQCRRGRYLRR
jgi:hypothetical protein